MISNALYLEDVEYIGGLDLPWEKLKNSSMLLSGAGGLVGSLIIDTVMYKNEREGLNCKIIALGRSVKRAEEKFSGYFKNPLFTFIEQDINMPLGSNVPAADYVLHLASNTHPLQYSTDPIGTISTNVIGTANMLEYASARGSKRVLFASSNEIYGENRGDTELFDERYCGYIDCNTLRAGYPESKRCGEALCQAYIRQRGADVVVARLTRSYGPTMLGSDTKAISQFIKKGIAGEDIVLKSEGNQYYSYTYVSDAVSGIFTVLLKGECGEAYNVADQRSDIRLKDLAGAIASYSGTRVVFEIPDETERAGYSTATVARLDGAKISALGWRARYDIDSGIKRTLTILKSL